MCINTKMIKINLYIFIIATLKIIVSCSNNNNKFEDTKIEGIDPILVYSEAIIELKKNDFLNASIKFKKILSEYPLTNEGIQSQIMLGFIDYANLEYSNAIYKFNKIIKMYPSHKNIDYAFYMRAMCYFEQIENEALDGSNNTESLKSFKEIVKRFPNSEYAKDSIQKIIFINENIAAKHMDIAMFYLSQKKYLASLNRYTIVIEDFSKSKFTPEALYRTFEIYSTLGMQKEAEKIAGILGFNYPKSKWYLYSYNMINKKKLKNKNSLRNKISNFLKIND